MRVWLPGCLLGCLIGLGAEQAVAGAWPREPGTWFLSAGFEAATTREALNTSTLAEDPSPDFTGYRTLYVEYGWAERLTFGLDAGQDDNQNGAWVGEQIVSNIGLPGRIGDEDATDWTQPAGWAGVVFMRRAIGAMDARHRFAVQIGLGARRYQQPGLYYGLEKMTEEAILRTSLLWGMGFDGPLGSGWAGLDGTVEFRATTGGTPVKLDAIVGIKHHDRLSYLFQVQSGKYPDSDAYVKLVPGVVQHFGHGLSLETSVIWGISGTDAVGLKAALWAEW